MVLEVAGATEADFLTFNTADFDGASTLDVRIVTPPQFLALIPSARPCAGFAGSFSWSTLSNSTPQLDPSVVKQFQRMNNLLCLFLAVSCALLPAHADPIRIRGSDALGAKLVPQLCELYRQSHLDISFQIAAEGSSSGFASLLDGRADIGMSNREASLKEAELFAERGIALSRWKAAMDVYVIAVHAKNPISNLTSKQVEAIFTGDIAGWADVGGVSAPISLLPRNISSAAYADFRRLAMSDRPYAKQSKSFGSQSPAQAVSQDEYGITYLSLAFARAPGIKALQIDGLEAVSPDPQKYPYLRPLFYFTRKPPGATVAAFLEWATRSDEARKLIVRTGFLPPE